MIVVQYIIICNFYVCLYVFSMFVYVCLSQCILTFVFGCHRYGERDFVKTDHPWRENILLERG